jgi:putative acetyltransferase
MTRPAQAQAQAGVGLRPLTPADGALMGRIFFCAVHEGARSAYGPDQRRAWAGETIDLARWTARAETLTGFVAELGGETVGFMTIDASGYIDLAFVLPSAARQGVGTRLLQGAEDWARRHAAPRLTTAASLIARPFFEKNGWHVISAEDVVYGGVNLRRFQMAKDLT